MGKQNKKKFVNRRKVPYQNSHEKKKFNNNNRGNETEKKREFIVKNSLREDQVGITEYLTSGEGFKGILKSRFSDFHVNEIDLDGDVLQLNDLSIPDAKEEELSSEELNAAKDELKNVISEEVWNKMNNLKDAKSGKTPEDSIVFIDVSELDKTERTRAHKLIKDVYKGKLLSSTVSGEKAGSNEADKRFIRVIRSNSNTYERKKWIFPEEYVHFLVHKENLDTSEVASAIAKKLNMRPSNVNYCGTKDKRAKTTQKFCIRKRTPRQIVGTVKFLNGVKIGNFQFKKNVLKLGDLKGNRFRIAIRNLNGDREHIQTLLSSVKENGFINYFGLQRFGNCAAIPTHEIGVALLKADYKLACELILKPRDSDIPFLKSIREMWWKNRDSKAAAAKFRGDGFIEKKLLDGLAQYGERDYAAALRKIPRNMLLLYPHAFQSLIFNIIASKRIKEFGLSLIPGDLVYKYRDCRDIEIESTELPEQEDEKDDDEKETENKISSSADTTSTTSIFKKKVIHLKEEDIASGDYTICDVVLPLPGYDVTYPENVVGSWYEELLGKYELSSEKLKHNVKLFALAGAYRRLVVKPGDMSWELKFYSSPDETLILSDLELLQGKKLEDFKKETCSDTKYEALLLDFSLPTASYATMLLRELLKCDTSAAAQSLLQQGILKEVEKIVVCGEKRKATENEDEEEEKTIKQPKLLKDSEPASVVE